jgi:hypothetical protein
MFMLRDGTRLSANFGAKIISLLKPPVKRFQFIQHDYERLEFRYEPADRDLNDKELSDILDILKTHMSPALEVDVRKTDEFIASTSNKHRTMICRVPPPAAP